MAANRWNSAGLVIVALVLPAAASTQQVTFTKDVAPILMKHCVQCHRPGEVAPMSLLTYDEARPWAKSIRQKVSDRNMPPWKIDPRFGRFKNDMRLSDEQIQTIVRWVDSGAPRGDLSDMPPAPVFPHGWTLGEPDYVIELPEMKVPASGDDLFPDRVIEIQLPERRWVKAIEFMPGDKRVVHHILALLGDFGMSSGEAARERRGGTQAEIFSVWVAGSQPTVYPEGAGRMLSTRQVMTFNMHYHPFGEETTDVTRIGLHFGEGELQKRITTTFAVNLGFRIPPGDPNHHVNAFYLFDQDSKIISFLPHMHVRGKDMTYHAVYPDGRRETLLSVPEYDYNWQWIYYPEEHIAVPAGTIIEVEAHYDNSPDNPSNPDPTREIFYRDETFQEMFVGFMEFIVDDGVAPRPMPAPEKIDRLLARHPAESSYKLGGLMGLPWGLYLPKEGEGMWYLSMGSVMFTSTVRNIQWDGDRFAFDTTMVTQGGGGISMSVAGQIGADGAVSGEITLGAMEAAEDPKAPPAQKLPFTGTRVSTAKVAAVQQ